VLLSLPTIQSALPLLLLLLLLLLATPVRSVLWRLAWPLYGRH
jgi:hypothetical protein